MQMIALQFFSKYLSLRLGLRRPTSLVRGRRTVSVLCRIIYAFCDTDCGVKEIPTAVCALPRNDVCFRFLRSFWNCAYLGCGAGGTGEPVPCRGLELCISRVRCRRARSLPWCRASYNLLLQELQRVLNICRKYLAGRASYNLPPQALQQVSYICRKVLAGRAL